MTFQIEIRLVSDTLFGAGRAGPGEVDIDSAFDSYGLPYIPGKRLKGLLFDAVHQFCRQLGPQAESKFRQFPDLNVGGQGAEPQGAQSIRAWIESQRQNPSIPSWLIQRDSISEVYAVRRRQTAVDPATRQAKPETLRVGRLVKKGTSFVAQVEIQAENDVDGRFWGAVMEAALSVGVSGGLRRHRGKGELAWTVGKIDTQPAAPQPLGTVPIAGTNQIRAILTFDTSPVLVRHSALGNELASDDFPSGRTLWSLFASRWWKTHTVSDFDEYYQLFLSGRNSISDATPWVDQRAATATPADGFLDKTTNTVSRMSTVDAPVPPSAQLERISVPFIVQGWKSWQGYRPTREFRVHNGHRVYTQESLRSGQEFSFVICGPDASMIAALVPPGVLRLGKSRTAEYGQVSINYEEFDEAPKQVIRSKQWRIVLTAPMAQRSPTGWFDLLPKTLHVALAGHLKKSPRTYQAFLKTNLRSGFQGNLSLPLNAVPVYESGTVLIWNFDEETELDSHGSVEGVGNEWGWGTFECHPCDSEPEEVRFETAGTHPQTPSTQREKSLPMHLVNSLRDSYLERLAQAWAIQWIASHRRKPLVRGATSSSVSALAEIIAEDKAIPTRLVELANDISRPFDRVEAWAAPWVRSWSALRGLGVLSSAVERGEQFSSQPKLQKLIRQEILRLLKKELKAKKAVQHA